VRSVAELVITALPLVTLWTALGSRSPDPVRILARLQPTFLAGRSAVFVPHHHDE